MTPQAALNSLLARRDLSREEMTAVMRQIMSGELTQAQISGIIVALRAKGETVTEIAAAAEVMRGLSLKVHASPDSRLIDTCGTGGDGAHTFNISTTSAIVAAAAGAKVAKHGGRSVSSSSGSADVLERLGVDVTQSAEQVAAMVDAIGIGFMFAPQHHSAMRFAAPVRKELGVRTIFNLLGPMTNPAGAKNQVMGVYNKELVPTLAQVLQTLGSEHVLVVHGEDGLDEITLSGKTHVAELKNGKISEYELSPEEFGIRRAPLAAIRAENPDRAKEMLLSVLDNEPGPAKDVVLLNAGAAIYVAGIAPTLAAGVKIAGQTISSGQARAKLAELVEFSKTTSG